MAGLPVASPVPGDCIADRLKMLASTASVPPRAFRSSIVIRIVPPRKGKPKPLKAGFGALGALEGRS